MGDFAPQLPRGDWIELVEKPKQLLCLMPRISRDVLRREKGVARSFAAWRCGRLEKLLARARHCFDTGGQQVAQSVPRTMTSSTLAATPPRLRLKNDSLLARLFLIVRFRQLRRTVDVVQHQDQA